MFEIHKLLSEYWTGIGNGIYKQTKVQTDTLTDVRTEGQPTLNTIILPPLWQETQKTKKVVFESTKEVEFLERMIHAKHNE